MKIKSRLSTLSVISLILVSPSTFAKAKPNIIFIEVDDLPAHYIGAMGGDFIKTPTIDKLANQGILFTNAVCQGTQCGPSRNSLIIGQYPHNIGMYQNGPFKGLPADTWSLPKAMQRAGYTTAHIGKSHIHPSKEGLKGTKEYVRTEGHRRLGFDYVWQSLGRAVVSGKAAEKGVDSYVDFLIDKGQLEKMQSNKGEPTTLPDDIYLDGLLTKFATKYISEQNLKPYFLWLNYSVPHGPYDVKQAYHDRVKDAAIPTPNATDDKGEGIPELLRPHLAKSEVSTKKAQIGNCANIVFLDEQVKTVLTAVKKSGQQDNTIIVFFSDHGILMGEHGLIHKSTLYKEVLNPTLIISDPRNKKTKRIDKPIQLLDLVKTTLDWGNASDADKQKPYGDSLIPLLTGDGKFTRNYAVGECPGYYAIVTKDYKYIAPFAHNKNGKELLFNLTNNPEETIDVAASNPVIIKAFRKTANEWLAKSGEVKIQAPVPDKKSKQAKKKKKAKSKK